MTDESPHSVFVDAWLARAPAAMSPDQVVKLFDRALRALCTRTQITLGEVTLTAIVSRVRELAVERHPLLAPTRVERARVCLDGVVLSDAHDVRELTQALRYVLVELLRVLGVLTSEILTPALRETLSGVTDALESQPREGTGR